MSAKEGLTAIQSLGAYFPHMVYPHQTSGMLLLGGRQRCQCISLHGELAGGIGPAGMHGAVQHLDRAPRLGQDTIQYSHAARKTYGSVLCVLLIHSLYGAPYLLLLQESPDAAELRHQPDQRHDHRHNHSPLAGYFLIA